MLVDRILTGAAALALLAGPAAACGADTDCAVGDRHYRIHLPAGHDGESPIGAIIFAHGYKGSAAGTMRNGALRDLADRLGVALVAGKSSGDDWSIPGAPSHGTVAGVDEVAYFDALRADITQRFAIDPARLMVAGFSAGGMMTWTLACARPADYAAFAPMAGTFWRPVPERCETPAATIMHLHGRTDRIVPLEGRRIADAHQGSIAKALAIYARTGGFGAPEPLRIGDIDCEDRRNAAGALLRSCLFDGGHSFRADFLENAWLTAVPGAG